MEMRGRTAVEVYDTDGERGGQAIERWFRPVGRGVLLQEQITGSNPEEVRRRIHCFPFCHRRSVLFLFIVRTKIYCYNKLLLSEQNRKTDTSSFSLLRTNSHAHVPF